MVAINGCNFNVSKIVDYLRPFQGNVAVSYDWGSPKNSDLDLAYEKGLLVSDEMDAGFYKLSGRGRPYQQDD